MVSKRLRVSLLLVLFVFTVSAAQAAQITQTFTVLLAPTNWSTTFNVNKFNLGLGTLNFIEFDMDGGVQGNATVTNNGATPEEVTVNIAATLRLNRPNTTLIVQAIPVVSQSTTLDASGGANATASWANQAASSNPTVQLSSLADKALFTGGGQIFLPVLASATSYYISDGVADVSASFSTLASAFLTVTYDYTPGPVPEPGTILLLGGGLAGLAARLRRRKAASIV